MSIFSFLHKKKKAPEKKLSSRDKVLSEVERLRLEGAKSQAMAVLEIAYRDKEISAYDYESAKTVLMREFD